MSTERLTPSMRWIISIMDSEGLTIQAFRDRKGRLHYVLSNNEPIPAVTVIGMINRDLLELVETTDPKLLTSEAHYRLRREK